MFGQSSFGSSGFGGASTGGISLGLGNHPNPMKDAEVTNPPDDSISCLRFSPPSIPNTSFLIAGSWDNNVRCWEIQSNGQSVPKSMQSMQVWGYLLKTVIKTSHLICFCLCRARFLTYAGTTTEAKYSWRLVTSRSNAGTSPQTKPCKWLNMKLQLKLSAGLKHPTTQHLWQDHGIKP